MFRGPTFTILADMHHPGEWRKGTEDLATSYLEMFKESLSSCESVGAVQEAAREQWMELFPRALNTLLVEMAWAHRRCVSWARVL